MRIRFLVALLLLAASPAGAASILYAADERYVSTSRSYSDSEDATGSGADGDAQYAPVQGQSWSSTWRAPSLVSTLEPSDITLEFSVRRALSYSNTYDYGGFPRTVSYYGPQDIASARIRFTVSDLTSSIWERDGVQWIEELVPGTYYEIREQITGGVNTGPAVVARSFSMRLVPEPGTAALLAFGVAMLARRRNPSCPKLE